MRIHRMRTEYLTEPLGIDQPRPRFSWLLEDEGYGKRQTAYRLLAASDPMLLEEDRPDLWDSGRIQSAATSQIRYGGRSLAFGQKVYWRCVSFDEAGAASRSDVASFTLGFLEPADRKAGFIYYDQGIDNQELAAPVCFAREVEIEREIRCAYAYVSALGVFTLDINGAPASENVLAPEWTSYFKRAQYQTYDVTGLLHRGKNQLTAMLSNGWYCGLWQMWPPRPHIYGGKYPEFFCQLEIEFTDGGRQTVITDQSWRATHAFPIRFAGIYEGETCDGRIAYPKLDNQAIWRPVSVGGRGDGLLLSAQKSEPIRVTQRPRPTAITEPSPGVYLVDFGQNFAGRIRARFHEPAGTQITIRHNEMLREDGRLYLDNLVTCEFTPGADRQVLRYTCRGGEEEYAPRFTYMGFRYVEITGLTQKPSLDDFTGEVFHTDFKRAGEFTCSDPLLTRLQQNIQWSHRSNTMGIPTDCPQRDERCGYTGDMQFFMPTALYNGDLAAFMHKWLTDLCADSQFPDGRFKDHAPDFGMNGGVVGWGEAGVICPYLCYKAYGDTANIEAHLPAMKRFADYLIATSNPDHTRGPDCVGLGDWLHMGGGASLEVVGSAYYAYVLSLVAEMADVMGDRQAAERYGGEAAAAKTAFSERFLLPDGSVKDSSLTGFALALTMGLVPPDKLETLSAAFAKEVKRQNYRLTTGFLGTPRLLMALGQIGRHDLAERLLMQRECPSWLYPVTVGATTVWERWNGWTKEQGFENPGMNSFNHFAFGSVGEYFFRYILGISQPPDGKGFSVFRIAPAIPDCLTQAAGFYESVNGRMEVQWKKIGGRVRLDITVPANATAEVLLPEDATGEPAAYLEKREKGFFCGSGRYWFYFS